MASRIMHLAVAESIIRGADIADEDRFRFGCILPDSAPQGVNSHLRARLPDGRKIYDLDSFRSAVGGLLPTDGLCLGYYMHLLQDIVFRDYVYRECGWNSKIPGNVDRLHNDYRLLNAGLIAQYNLSAELSVPVSFDQSPLMRLASFNGRKVCDDLHEDFTLPGEGKLFFFSMEMAQIYISRASELCLRELSALRRGEKPLDALTYAY